jgi:hypothetical protein
MRVFSPAALCRWRLRSHGDSSPYLPQFPWWFGCRLRSFPLQGLIKFQFLVLHAIDESIGYLLLDEVFR